MKKMCPSFFCVLHFIERPLAVVHCASRDGCPSNQRSCGFDGRGFAIFHRAPNTPATRGGKLAKYSGTNGVFVPPLWLLPIVWANTEEIAAV